jgi:protein translocase SecG subunit
MYTALQVIQLIVAFLLVIAILLQAQGGGLSPVFGGGGEMYRSKQSIEKFLMIATAVLILLLSVVSIALLIIPR